MGSCNSCDHGQIRRNPVIEDASQLIQAEVVTIKPREAAFSHELNNIFNEKALTHFLFQFFQVFKS